MSSRTPVGGLWPLAHGKSLSFDRPLVMGILNVTPDSFSDGGDFATRDAAVDHAWRMVEEGANIIDIGGESTRPGAEEITAEEERRRVIPVIEALSDLPVPISIDTRRSRVMQDAVTAGAAIINDVTALTFDADSADVAAASGAGVILMHAQGNPETMQQNPTYGDVTEDVFAYLADRLAVAEGAGIARERLVADPGIGFGKTVAHNLTLLRELERFHDLGVALLIGVSRKRFIGTITGTTDAKDRVAGSLAAGLFSAQKGAQILRVHDVAETKQALAVLSAIENGS